MRWSGRGNTLAGMSYKGISLLNIRASLRGQGKILPELYLGYGDLLCKEPIGKPFEVIKILDYTALLSGLSPVK